MSYADDPGARIEAVFRRIHAERMAGLPLLNPAISVAAVGFERSGSEWRGVLVTPWSISLMLLPATESWPAPRSHERVFRTFPAGTFAFLGNREDGIGDYLVCPLVHDMAQFADHDTAVLTARACLIALDLAPEQAAVDHAVPEQPGRRKFMTLGS